MSRSWHAHAGKFCGSSAGDYRGQPPRLFLLVLKALRYRQIDWDWLRLCWPTQGRKFEMDHAFSKQWHCVGPIASTHPASPIPLLHRWLPDRFCLNNQPAIHTSCTSTISLCGWPASLLLLDRIEADGFRRQAHSETCSAQESRLETYYAVGPNSYSFDCYARDGCLLWFRTIFYSKLPLSLPLALLASDVLKVPCAHTERCIWRSLQYVSGYIRQFGTIPPKFAKLFLKPFLAIRRAGLMSNKAVKLPCENRNTPDCCLQSGGVRSTGSIESTHRLRRLPIAN